MSDIGLASSKSFMLSFNCSLDIYNIPEFFHSLEAAGWRVKMFEGITVVSQNTLSAGFTFFLSIVKSI